MPSVVKSKEALSDLADLILIGVAAAKSGGSMISLLPHLWAAAGKVKELIDDSQNLLPELQDVDAQEAGELAAAAYSAIKKVIDGLKV